MLQRCRWAETHPLNIEYHDTEWGTPVHDEQVLFEFLILEGAQAGLSWLTVLKKRAEYRKAFDSFHPEKVAAYDTNKIEELLTNEGIIRNKLKIEAAVQNGKAFLAVREEYGSFDAYIWNFVGGQPIKNGWISEKEIPAMTKESMDMSYDLKKRGFRFVGPTICYAFMQAVGMVNDHTVDCFRYHEV